MDWGGEHKGVVERGTGRREGRVKCNWDLNNNNNGKNHFKRL